MSNSLIEPLERVFVGAVQASRVSCWNLGASEGLGKEKGRESSVHTNGRPYLYGQAVSLPPIGYREFAYTRPCGSGGDPAVLGLDFRRALF